ncbi:uncharacterized protein LOC134784577 [Penaeus indicus]|uniref:uncharacterized protein LOC134784577 n=1 Tax=Penaeus indicus TaxID=29960 RepID=UPI00300D7980
MALDLHTVLGALWHSGSISPDLLRGVVIPVWKGKGDCWDCSGYRGIALLNIPGTAFAHVLLKRIRDHLLRHQRPEQSGFTPGKSTIDRILALRVTEESRYKLSCSQPTSTSRRQSVVKCGGGLLNFFPLNSGVRQNCVLTPTLFNTCLYWIMGIATIQSLWNDTGQYQECP